MHQIDPRRMEDIAQNQPAFSRAIGIEVVSIAADKVVMRIQVGEIHANRNGVMHGGALLALADNTGGTASSVLIADDQMTTTLESKINFFRSIELGDVATATATPLHLGRRTHVWQIAIHRGDGKLAAQVTQTQMVMSPRKG